MKSGNPYGEIAAYSTPIILSMVMQNFMGLVDGALVGSLGTSALAAYGIAFFIHFIHASFLMGLATAVQAITSQIIGHGDKSESGMPINAAIIASIIFGGLIAFFSHHYTGYILPFMVKDENVLKLTTEYLDVRFLGIFAIGITHSFRGFWNGIGKPSTFLVIMTLSYVFNGFISYAFIGGHWGAPAMGLSGAALGSVLATVLAAIINFGWAAVTTKDYGFNRNYFNKIVWKKLISQSLPSGLTQLLFALGYAVFFAIIGKLGTSDLAAANVLVTISLFLIYPAMAMGMTASNYVGTSIGAGDKGKAFLWVKRIAVYSSVLFAVISIPFLVFHNQLLSIFIHDENVLLLAKAPFLIFGVTLVIEVLGYIYTFAFLGAGKPKVVLLVTTGIQWLGIIPFSYYFGHDLLTIWTIQTFFRCLQALILYICWMREKNYSLSSV